MNPIAIAARGKGLWNTFRRVSAISRHYGINAGKMDRILTRFSEILSEHAAKATFPITTTALARSNGFSETHQSDRIEFATHGYYHVDHIQLSADQQKRQLIDATWVFQDKGVTPSGFRCPYLRWNDDTISAVKKAGFMYDSSQALAWDVLEANSITDAYKRVLEFYGALPATKHPALPRTENGLVRIPYCLPDDEALADRLSFPDSQAMNRVWPDILAETHELGELFTLGLHPERLDLCEPALIQTLQAAAELVPEVWFARLDEIATWWLARAQATTQVEATGEGRFAIRGSGPKGLKFLVRGLAPSCDSTAWDHGYRLVSDLQFEFKAEKRPFIGVAPGSDPRLKNFLKQQGFITEPAPTGTTHALFLDVPQFNYANERSVLTQIENADTQIIRFGRWPDGAKSALCVTGDIDALTIWDYLFRFIGK